MTQGAHLEAGHLLALVNLPGCERLRLEVEHGKPGTPPDLIILARVTTPDVPAFCAEFRRLHGGEWYDRFCGAPSEAPVLAFGQGSAHGFCWLRLDESVWLQVWTVDPERMPRPRPRPADGRPAVVETWNEEGA